MSRNFKNKNRFQKKKDRSMPRNKKDQTQDSRLERVEKKIHNLNSLAELKYSDTTITTPAGTGGVLTLINGVGQGADVDLRVGAEIIMTSAQVHITMTTVAGTVGPTRGRLILVLDRQCNGLAVDVSGNPQTGGVANIPLLNDGTIGTIINSPYALETKKRYKVLFDRKYNFNPQITGVAVSKVVDIFVKLNHKVKYNGPSAAITDMVTNSLTLVQITDVANGITFLGGTRVIYKDL